MSTGNPLPIYELRIYPIESNVSQHMKYKITKKESIIGRSKHKCDITLIFSDISEVHAKLTINGINDYLIRDLNSESGVFRYDSETNTKQRLNPNKDYDLLLDVPFYISRYKCIFSESRNSMAIVQEKENVIETAVVQQKAPTKQIPVYGKKFKPKTALLDQKENMNDDEIAHKEKIQEENRKRLIELNEINEEKTEENNDNLVTENETDEQEENETKKEKEEEEEEEKKEEEEEEEDVHDEEKNIVEELPIVEIIKKKSLKISKNKRPISVALSQGENDLEKVNKKKQMVRIKSQERLPETQEKKLEKVENKKEPTEQKSGEIKVENELEKSKKTRKILIQKKMEIPEQKPEKKEIIEPNQEKKPEEIKKTECVKNDKNEVLKEKKLAETTQGQTKRVYIKKPKVKKEDLIVDVENIIINPEKTEKATEEIGSKPKKIIQRKEKKIKPIFKEEIKEVDAENESESPLIKIEATVIENNENILASSSTMINNEKKEENKKTIWNFQKKKKRKKAKSESESESEENPENTIENTIEKPEKSTSSFSKKKPIIYYIGISGFLLENESISQLKKLGIQIIEDKAKPINLLIMQTFKRTIRFLMAINKGIEITDKKWIDDCLQQGKILDYMEYQFKDKQSEKNLGFKLQESLTKSRENNEGVFKGCSFWISKATLPSYDEIKLLIMSGGGTLLRKRPLIYDINSYIIMSNEEEEKVEKLKEEGFKVHSNELVFSACLKQKLDFEKNLL